ncbi:GntG family PLP-dependent aldolase [Humitalea sp. 24SJ18S-53]|uniref:GntG family PLP-dependent aldolase n=1 Tax=Humitalea sp. 24SJ18S-53 TaxID=3422307 RepID=UPI003D66B592
MIDLRSDTLTRPSPAMRAAMAAAEVGDDGYAEDPTVRALEEAASARLGKQAALFMPSGTMGNLCALVSHARRGAEVLLEATSHIQRSELGGIAALAGLPSRPLAGVRGAVPLAALEAVCEAGEYGVQPKPGLLCLETSHNAAGGAVLPLDYLAGAAGFAARHGMPLHLDGARLFNAAVALGVPAEAIARHADSVTFCLSKGLGAPVGSLLCGTADFIGAARRNRRMLGGTMRQAGVLAAAGLVALESMVERLAEDHARAKRLATGLAEIAPSLCDPAAVETNILFVDFAASGIPAADWARRLAERGIACRAASATRMRFVLHLDIDDAGVAAVLAAIGALWPRRVAA